MASPTMASPHDALFCQVFADPRHAAGLLRALLPPDVERLVAWSSLERLPDTYKDAEDGDRHAHLLFGVELSRPPTRILSLLEHKSHPDRRTMFQLLRYVVRILDRFRQENPTARRLPPIVPAVVHHDAGGWHHGTELIELFDLDDRARAAFRPYLPALRFLVDDLTRVSPEDLARWRLTALAYLTLRCLQSLRAGADAASAIRSLRDAFRAAYDAPDTGSTLSAVLSYIAKIWDAPREDLCALIRVELGPELEDLMTSTYDQVLNEGIERGRAEGKAEGKAEALLALLASRFAPPTTDVLAQVRTASSAQLDRWLLRVLDARTVAEVFAGE